MNVVSLSGGKDSTAMLLMMLERGEQIDNIIFFDTGWEWPQMYEHLALLEKRIGRKITRLYPRQPFNYWFSERPVRDRTTKQVKKYGYGWPTMRVRWCTAIKRDAIRAYCNGLTFSSPVLPITQCIGYACDEIKRVGEHTKLKVPYQVFRYPLVEYGVSEADALSYCKAAGFTFGGLYDVFKRVSCLCCPLGGIAQDTKIRENFPDVWKQITLMNHRLSPTHPGMLKTRMGVGVFERKISNGSK